MSRCSRSAPHRSSSSTTCTCPSLEADISAVQLSLNTQTQMVLLQNRNNTSNCGHRKPHAHTKRPRQTDTTDPPESPATGGRARRGRLCLRVRLHGADAVSQLLAQSFRQTANHTACFVKRRKDDCVNRKASPGGQQPPLRAAVKGQGDPGACRQATGCERLTWPIAAKDDI